MGNTKSNIILNSNNDNNNENNKNNNEITNTTVIQMYITIHSGFRSSQ